MIDEHIISCVVALLGFSTGVIFFAIALLRD